MMGHIYDSDDLDLPGLILGCISNNPEAGGITKLTENYDLFSQNHLCRK